MKSTQFVFMKKSYYLFTLLMITLLIVPKSTSLAQTTTPRPNKPALGNTTTTKPKKAKKPKIKYQYHQGTATLKTGLQLKGNFKYIEAKNSEMPYYVVTEQNKKGKKTVALPMIKSIILQGAERGITARKDSTEFIWIDEYKDLYRKVRGGTINVYDNSRVVNESYDYLTDYILIVGRSKYGYKQVKAVNDLNKIMEDRPYFIQSAKATNRLNSKDFRVVLYLIDLFNDNNPIKTLKWDNMKVVLRNGEKLNGFGYIQPFDMRNEYLNSENAYLHFHDGKDFRLIKHYEIKSLDSPNIDYTQGLYTVVNRYFLGKKWQLQNENYVVVTRLINTNNYYFKNNQNSPQNIVILKKAGGNYVKPLNEQELRKAYMLQQKAVMR